MRHFNDEIKKKIDATLLPILDQFIDGTSTLFLQKTSHEIKWKPDEDIYDLFNNYIDMLWGVYVSKFSQLMESIIESVNRNDFLTYALISRSLIEHAAVLRHYFHEQIIPKLEEPIKKGTVTDQELQEIARILDKHLRGGRFDWKAFFMADVEKIIKNKPEGIPEQVRVGTCIEKWAKEIQEVGVLYNLFCDLVHPNVGTTLLVLRQWPEGIGVGGHRGEQFGIEIFNRTFYGLCAIVKEVVSLLNKLLLLRFPENTQINHSKN